MFPTSFTSIDGLRLCCYAARPSTNPPRAHVILVHGLGDHGRSLPYRYLTDYLTAHQFAVYTYDWRGHGQSEGPRMFTPAWQNVGDDLHTFVDLVQREVPGGPLFLVGLSLGGLLALHYAHQQPHGLSGVVAIAPAVDASGVPPLVRWMIPVLARLAPRAAINPGLDLAHISRDATAVQAYTSDPHFQTHTTPRLAAEVLKAMSETEAQASSFKLPLLILHGEADTIVRPAGSAHFFAQVPIADKERLTYPGAYHNLLIEQNREQVFADMRQWLEWHL